MWQTAPWECSFTNWLISGWEFSIHWPHISLLEINLWKKLLKKKRYLYRKKKKSTTGASADRSQYESIVLIYCYRLNTSGLWKNFFVLYGKTWSQWQKSCLKKKKEQQKNPKHMFQFTGQLISSPEAILIFSLGMSINQCHKPSVRQYAAEQLPCKYHAHNPKTRSQKSLNTFSYFIGFCFT